MKKKLYKPKGFTKIDRLIDENAKSHNFEQLLYKHKVVKCWQRIAGSFVEAAEEQTRVLDLKKGVLIVACLSIEIARKLKAMASSIVLALNQFLGKDIIFGLYFEV